MKAAVAAISNNALFAAGISFMVGIALSHPWRLPDRAMAALGFALVLLTLASLLLHIVRRPPALLLLLPLFAGAGFWHSQVHLQPPAAADHIFWRIEQKTEAVLVGTLAAMVAYDGTTSRIELLTEQIQRRDDPGLMACSGKALLRFNGMWPADLLPGDRLVIRGELNRPQGFNTPGSFNIAGHYAREGIWVTGFIRSPLFIDKIVTTPSWWRSVRFLPERMRTAIGQRLDLALPESRQSGMYRALLLGDRSRLSEEILENFKASGTMHILAISGLHIGILSALLFTAFYRLLCLSEWVLLRWPVRKLAAMLCLPVLLCYGLLAGLNTPVTRAVLMGGLVLIAACVDRRKSPGALLAFAALAILAVQPMLLYSVSFQLSFAAVTALLFLLPELQRLILPKQGRNLTISPWQKAGRWLVAALLVSTVANLATMPIAIDAFQRFSPIGLIANLIIEPLICLWSLVAGFVAIPVLFFQPELGALLLRGGGLGLEAALSCAAFFAALPYASLRLPPAPLWLLASYYGMLLALLCTGRRHPALALIALAGLSLCMLMIFRSPSPPGDTEELRITTLDIGQGSCSLVELPCGYRLLVDGGGASYPSSTVGERIIAPYLWQRGFDRIDAVIVTHPDADHYNGLDFIIRHFSPQLLWVRADLGHDEGFARLLQLADRQGVKVVVPAEGERLGDHRGFLENVANSYLLGVGEGRSSGNSGLILKACSGDFCTLFPGDIEQEDENLLVTMGYDLTATLLLAPHHGANTSSSAAFLAGVSPDYILVSAGRGREGSFPGETLVKASRHLNIPLWTTAREGTIEVLARRDGLEIHGHGREKDNPLSPLRRLPLHRQTVFR